MQSNRFYYYGGQISAEIMGKKGRTKNNKKMEKNETDGKRSQKTNEGIKKEEWNL